MKIFTQTIEPKLIEQYVVDVIGIIAVVDEKYAAKITAECDIFLIEMYMPEFLGIEGTFTGDVISVAICPRKQNTFAELEEKWHEVVGKILPYRCRGIDPETIERAAQEKGWINGDLVDGRDIYSKPDRAKDLNISFDDFTSILPYDSETIMPYMRTLYKDLFFYAYPTFDLWQPVDIEAISLSYPSVYCVEEFKSNESKRLELKPISTKEDVKHPEWVAVLSGTIEDYQQFYQSKPLLMPNIFI